VGIFTLRGDGRPLHRAKTDRNQKNEKKATAVVPLLAVSEIPPSAPRKTSPVKIENLAALDAGKGERAIIENRTFDEIAVGDSADVERTLKHEDIQLFAITSGDLNPTHLEDDVARTCGLRAVTAHGMWSAGLISAVLGVKFPGPGTVYAGQNLRFHAPVRVGDTVTATIRATAKDDATKRVIFDCSVTNQSGALLVSGEAEVIAPTRKIARRMTQLPELLFEDKAARYQRLIGISRGLDPIPMAVVHPCDSESLRGALQARDAGLIVPVLIGPMGKIRAVAEEEGLSLHGVSMIDACHSHAAAERAVKMARDGEVLALMKGSLHTDELMGAVVKRDDGLRTSRRVSHVFLMDLPTYSSRLLITDAAINIDPTLEEKADIVQNAIDMAIMLGIETPRVAILAAVETVHPKMRSTLDAAALCKMADRGQIKGGLLDGPLAFDNAISLAAARTKGIRSEVAGRAEILLVPDLESGNMIAKQLEYLAHAVAAGIVLGARVPIVLTSRADNAQTRAASCAIAQVLAHAKIRPEG
jgi:phosphate acetyltransferase